MEAAAVAGLGGADAAVHQMPGMEQPLLGQIGVDRGGSRIVYMDFPYSLLMTGFSAMAIDIYKGITEIVSAIVKKIRK